MSRVLGLGTDIVKLARFDKIVTRNGLASRQTKAFALKVLHPERELPLFDKHVQNNDLTNTVKVLAGSWAMKEAVFKCLDDKDQSSQRFRDWYKYNTSNGRPKVGGSYLEQYPNEEFLLSISHDEDILIATVIRQLTT